ncbi:MAG: nucleotidyltransferase family protein [Candidatus Micrarchaeaceae archaeon]
MQTLKRVVHYPTLKTILAIEEVVKKADAPISRNQILARLSTGVMRSTLNLALSYMEKHGIVLETRNGFIWTFTPNKKLEEAESEGPELSTRGTASMANDIEKIKRTAVPILKDNGVKRAAIFGSVARGEAKSTSDVDLLVEFRSKPTLFDLGGLKMALEEKLKRSVDLVMFSAIDSRLKEHILKEMIGIL